MLFNEVLNSRYSVREYSNKPVEKEKIDEILGAVRLAPTAKNSQPQAIYVANTETALNKMDLVTPNRFGAPVAIIICGDSDKACILKSNGRNFLEVDVTIIQTYMMLKASDLGLGTCWIGRFDGDKAHEVFSIPKNHVPYGILLIGYPSETAVASPRHTERLEVKDFVKYL